MFSSKDYTNTTYYLEMKDGLLDKLDPPFPVELQTGYEKGPNFRRVTGLLGPGKKRKAPEPDLRAEVEATEAKLVELKAKLAAQEESQKDAMIAKARQLSAALLQMGVSLTDL